MPSTRAERLLVIDNSNSFTKFAVAHQERLSRVRRVPTPAITEDTFREALESLAYERAILASVVPEKAILIYRALDGAPFVDVSPSLDLGIAIDYPKPTSIGADRLANAAACAAYHRTPAIVVDFGTAVTFDVLSAQPAYIGGVIAPGLEAMTHYLHSRTALLPRITLAEPTSAIGKSTTEAMLAGAVHGYRGLIREILDQIRREAFPDQQPLVIATGGDAKLIAGSLPLFDLIEPNLTLHGLRAIGARNQSTLINQSNSG